MAAREYVNIAKRYAEIPSNEWVYELQQPSVGTRVAKQWRHRLC